MSTNIIDATADIRTQLSQISDAIANEGLQGWPAGYVLDKIAGVENDLKHIKGQIKHKAKEKAA